MKVSERIIFALVTITLGVLLIAWRGDIIQVLMTVLGIALLVLGVLDWIERGVKIAAIKLFLGVLSLAFGWLLVPAVSYILATALVLFAVYLAVDFFRCGNKISLAFRSISLWIKPVLFFLMGLFLFLNNGGDADWAFVLVGVMAVPLGGILLAEAFINN